MASLSEPMASLTAEGRRYCGLRKVRLGDVDTSGRLRLDGLTRYTQDVSNDDTIDAGLDEDAGWVVRKTVVDVLVRASFGETLTLTTFCGGLGRSWAERRVTVRGDRGAWYEVATLWIHLDPVSARPAVLFKQFVSVFGSAAQGRRVSARLTLPRPATAGQRRTWPTRVVDFDTQMHMNNAAYWAVVEELLADRSPLPMVVQPFRAVIEYGSGIAPGDDVEVEVVETESELGVWWYASGQHSESESESERRTAAVQQSATAMLFPL